MAFRECVAQLCVQLHPSCIQDPTPAIERELDSKLLTFDEGLGGVVLAYDHIVVEEPCGRVRLFCDSHYLNVHLSASLTLFCPKEGSKLVGEVNFMTDASIGLLVHGTFNASIQDEAIPDSWDLGDGDGEDYWEQKSTGKCIEIGTYVAFGVLGVTHSDNIMSIRGSMLNEEEYGVCGKAAVPIAERRQVEIKPMTPTLQPSSKKTPQMSSKKSPPSQPEHFDALKVTPAISEKKRKNEDPAGGGSAKTTKVNESPKVKNSPENKKRQGEQPKDDDKPTDVNTMPATSKHRSKDSKYSKEKKGKKAKKEKKEKK